MSFRQKSLRGHHVNVGMMTSGGLAPCLSASVAQLIKYWTQAYREGTITGLSFRFYFGGYKGILIGDSVILPEEEWDTAAETLLLLGGSPIGNSRVKVTTCI